MQQQCNHDVLNEMLAEASNDYWPITLPVVVCKECGRIWATVRQVGDAARGIPDHGLVELDARIWAVRSEV